MERVMKVNGWKILVMVMVFKNGLMEHDMKVIGFKTMRRVQESFGMLTEIYVINSY
jgi:hypothetical protein